MSAAGTPRKSSWGSGVKSDIGGSTYGRGAKLADAPRPRFRWSDADSATTASTSLRPQNWNQGASDLPSDYVSGYANTTFAGVV